MEILPDKNLPHWKWVEEYARLNPVDPWLSEQFADHTFQFCYFVIYGGPIVFQCANYWFDSVVALVRAEPLWYLEPKPFRPAYFAQHEADLWVWMSNTTMSVFNNPWYTVSRLRIYDALFMDIFTDYVLRYWDFRQEQFSDWIANKKWWDWYNDWRKIDLWNGACMDYVHYSIEKYQSYKIGKTKTHIGQYPQRWRDLYPEIDRKKNWLPKGRGFITNFPWFKTWHPFRVEQDLIVKCREDLSAHRFFYKNSKRMVEYGNPFNRIYKVLYNLKSRVM